MEVFLPLVQEEELSPNEYFKLVHSKPQKMRKRASKSNLAERKEDSEW
jgi:hypothetical protein